MGTVLLIMFRPPTEKLPFTMSGWRRCQRHSPCTQGGNPTRAVWLSVLGAVEDGQAQGEVAQGKLQRKKAAGPLQALHGPAGCAIE